MEGTSFISMPEDLMQKGKNQINNNMTIYNGSTEDERLDSIEKESANTKENREDKQLLY